MQQTVVCAGDSTTAGLVASNYVEKLCQRLLSEQFEVINAGVNGDLSHDLLRRIDKVIAHNPDIVAILIGTNDVNYRFDQNSWRRYQRRATGVKLPSLTPERFRQNYTEIITRLQMAGVRQTALVSLPMQGEALDHPINQCVLEYNQIILNLATQFDLPYLPLYERLHGLLDANHHRPRQPYAYSYPRLLRAIIRHYLLHQSWDRIAFANGLLVLTDHLHLSDLGATVVAELLACLLTEK